MCAGFIWLLCALVLYGFCVPEGHIARMPDIHQDMLNQTNTLHNTSMDG